MTNQGGVARGRYGEDDVDRVHREIAGLVDHAANRRGLIDRFYYCPFHPEATVEAYRRALAHGLVGTDERVVLFNCATGLKYPMAPVERTIARGAAIDYAAMA